MQINPATFRHATPIMETRIPSNKGLEEQIEDIETLMQGLSPGTPEYQFYELELQKYKIEQQVREENPDIDPTTHSGYKALQQIIDPLWQPINKAIRELCLEHPNESLRWAIPLPPNQEITVIPA